MSKFNQILLLISALGTSLPFEGIAKITSPVNFISAQKKSEISINTIRTFTSYFGQNSIAKLLKYGVKSYTVVYETNWKGQVIKASGLVLIPSGVTQSASILSIQHGTSFAKDEAPTVIGGLTGIELFASAGYIVFMPDYIGYGSSRNIFHPYYDKNYSADAVIDMISAGKQFLKKEGVSFNEKIFLAGYSEGGYVTLAAAAKIESQSSSDIKLAAVAAGAGGYNLNHMLKGITSTQHYGYPAYLAFVLMAYNNTYDWNKPLGYFFRKQYAYALSKYMGGAYEGWSINQHLTTNLPTLFDQEFYGRLKKPEGEPTLKAALKSNTITGWKTNTPIRLYHGTNDEIIPFENSEVTLKSFHDAGSRDVTLTPISNGTHGSSFFPMLKLVLPWLVQVNY